MADNLDSVAESLREQDESSADDYHQRAQNLREIVITE